MDRTVIRNRIKRWIVRKENGNYWWRLRKKHLNAKNIVTKTISMYRYHKYLIKMCAHIPIEASFGSMPVLPHGIYGIFISLGAVIGKDCVIFQQVTIGSNTIMGSKRIGSPVIGNNVYIGAGAKIIGNVKIGNHVRIGANCVVTKDIPDNATVVSGENKVILHEEVLDNSFYYYDQVKNV